MIVACLIRESVIVPITKITESVYCVEIKGTDYMFQTYEMMYECILELLENGFSILDNRSVVIKQMVEQYEMDIVLTDSKVIRRIQNWFEEC